MLARKQIAKLETPAQKCADLVFEELQRLLHRLERKEHRRFPNLAAKMVEIASELLRERLEPTLEMIESLVRIEMAYINTNHPDFCRAGASLGVLAKIVDDRRNMQKSLSLSKSISDEMSVHHPGGGTCYAAGKKDEPGFLSYLFRGQPLGTAPGQGNSGPRSTRDRDRDREVRLSAPIPSSPTKNRQQALDHSEPLSPPLSAMGMISLSEKEEVETQLIVTLLHSYFSIVRKNLLDSVPKAVMHFLVNHVVEQLGTRLVTELYRDEMFPELLREDESVVKQRARCKTALEAYRQAAQILSELRDSEVSSPYSSGPGT